MLKLVIFILVSIQSQAPSGGEKTPIITEADWEWLASRTDIKRPNHFNNTGGEKQPNLPTPSTANNERPNHEYNFNLDNLAHEETPRVPLAEWTLFPATHTGNLKIQNDGNVRNVYGGQHPMVNQKNFLLRNHSINANIESLYVGQSPLVQLAEFELQANRSNFKAQNQLESANLISLPYDGHPTEAQPKSSKVKFQHHVLNATVKSVYRIQPSTAPLAEWILRPTESDSKLQTRNLTHIQPTTTAPADRRIIANEFEIQNSFNMSSAYNQSQAKLPINAQGGYRIPVNQNNIGSQRSGGIFYNASRSPGPVPTIMPVTNGLFANQTTGKPHRFNTTNTFNQTRGQIPRVPHTDIGAHTNQSNFGNPNRTNNTHVGHSSTITQHETENRVRNITLNRLYFVNTPSVDIPHDNDTVIQKESQIPDHHMRTRINCRCVINGRCARRESCEESYK